jgi:hypothetical protein
LGSLFLRIATAGFFVALSPVPVVAVLIILLTKRARLSSLVFASAWVAGNAVAIAIGIIFANQIRVPHAGQDLPAEGVVTLVLGIGLITTAWLSRRGRQRTPEENPPRWVAAVDNLSPVGGALVAFSNATTSPKNLALALTTGVAIRASLPHFGSELAAGMVYVFFASLTIVIPVLVYFVVGERARPTLARWKERVTSRAAVTMELLLFAAGIFLAAKGVWNLLT